MCRETEESGRQQSNSDLDRRGLTFQEWVRKKDAEKRLRKKLIQDMKNDVRADLLEVAKEEQSTQEIRVKYMEDWLM